MSRDKEGVGGHRFGFLCVEMGSTCGAERICFSTLACFNTVIRKQYTVPSIYSINPRFGEEVFVVQYEFHQSKSYDIVTCKRFDRS